MPAGGIPVREVRAAHDGVTMTVYQAFSVAIAEPALAAGRFVAPFSLGRMTWIKPSFLWMMYRCGWSTKPGQERTLAVDIPVDAFFGALRRSSLSHFEADVHGSRADWEQAMASAPVRVQWDPERDLLFRPLPHRSIQVGLSGEVAADYAHEWIVAIRDVTEQAHALGRLVAAGRLDEAADQLPVERPLPLPADLRLRLGVGA